MLTGVMLQQLLYPGDGNMDGDRDRDRDMGGGDDDSDSEEGGEEEEDMMEYRKDDQVTLNSHTSLHNILVYRICPIYYIFHTCHIYIYLIMCLVLLLPIYYYHFARVCLLSGHRGCVEAVH